MPDNYILLERTELNAAAASVTFANIPQTGYTDLKIVLSTRGDVASVQTATVMKLNALTSGYADKYIFGSGSSAGSGSFGASGGFIGDAPAASATANTFGNQEVYLPNYASNVAKSWSVDSVAETNATTAYMELTAGYNSTTSAITAITFTPSSGNYVAGSTFSLYGIAALGTTPVIAPKAIGGNIIDFDGTNWIHTFTSSGTFTPLQGLTCDYLVVAGGGGGGQLATGAGAGGGGAGGLRSTVTATGGGGALESALSLLSGTPYTVTIGAGGAAGSSSAGTNGVNSVFATITSTGGGGGAPGNNAGSSTGSNGGSGGGSGSATTTRTGGLASPSGQGYAGGVGAQQPTNYGGGGGGGAGAIGNNGGVNGGAGGNGVATLISGTSTTYGGGGGGAISGAGGTGGGGIGGTGGGTGATAGTTNTGGGGGSGYGSGFAMAGGSGIVIIRYPA
jgi:hypothetical protein